MHKLLLCLTLVAVTTCTRYEPNWQSLDSRPLPAWYDESKIGIFLTWGVFSVPSYTTEWFWWQWVGLTNMSSDVAEFMKQNYPPDFTYGDFARMFTTEFYDPDQWTEIFKASGAKYVVLICKHHDGFTLWPSKRSWNWNAMDVGPKRDLVGELAKAVRKTDIHFGVYHSLFEWFNPLYLQDLQNNYKTQDFVAQKTMPELYELVNNYQPDIVWSDGAWMAPDTYFNSTHFLAWLYNDSPVKDKVVTNDRWGNNTECKHGGFFNCQDKFDPSKLPGHKWEDAMSIDKFSWSYRRPARLQDLYSPEDLIALLVRTVSLGGNLLVDVGPTHDGRIPPIYEERLRQMGQWLAVNGEAIYSTKPWIFQRDFVFTNTWYTAKNTSESGEVVYAIMLDWYGGSDIILGYPDVGSNTRITMLGHPDPLPFLRVSPGRGVVVTLPFIPVSRMPCLYAWALRLEGLSNRRA